MMLNQYMKELEQENFEPQEFIERLAWRTISETRQDNQDFNSHVLQETFIHAIKDLEMLKERQKKKCDQLEKYVSQEEQSFSAKVVSLQGSNKDAFKIFGDLDERINNIATRIIHLGEQLESINEPRSRTVEARKLMTYLNAFIESRVDDTLFDLKNNLNESAEIIQKLQLIAQDLPSPKFDEVKKKIGKKYDEIERALIEDFVRAQNVCDVNVMKKVASILCQFKGYSQCVDAFIEQAQSGSFTGKDIFVGLMPLCEKNHKLIQDVFQNPEQVMSKFILNIFHLKLQLYVTGKLKEERNLSLYLKNLSELYLKTQHFCKDLAQCKISMDEKFLSKLLKHVFREYLDSYMSVEIKYLKDKYNSLLQRYYESKKHQKKQFQASQFQDLRRDLQAVIGTRANINIAQIENFGGETFLSEELSINMLQDSKAAFDRCQMLLEKNAMGNEAMKIFDVLTIYLINEHVDYALELGLQNVPIAEGSKGPPEIYFLSVVRQTNAIVHLYEKQFSDCLLPLIESTSKHVEYLEKNRNILKQIETKLDMGLDRSLQAIIGWVKSYLTTEQKKNDFKPEREDIDILPSPACVGVTQYISNVIKLINENLDGENKSQVLKEIGVRLHRVIFDHLLQFQYNSIGAMCVICDVNEYRKYFRKMGTLVEQLFDALYSLSNLLLVKPENLQQVCDGEQLIELDRSILLSFIQLRSDYKTKKLAMNLTV